MSTLQTKTVRLGDSATLANNFELVVPSVPDGTFTLQRQDGTDVLTVNAAGKVVIPGVVGTVSQSSGIPTGQIVESGSNANGRYVRFADGTQICYRMDASTTNVDIVTASAGWFFGTLTVTFPIAFVDNFVSVNHVSSSGGVITSYAVVSQTSTTVNLRFMSGTSNAAVPQFVGYIAIGRWF